PDHRSLCVPPEPGSISRGHRDLWSADAADLLSDGHDRRRNVLLPEAAHRPMRDSVPALPRLRIAQRFASAGERIKGSCTLVTNHNSHPTAQLSGVARVCTRWN